MAKYLVEIKYRVISILILFFTFMGTIFFYKFYFIHLILWVNPRVFSIVLNITSITELFDIFLKISFFLVKYFLFYYIYYHCVCFLALGLFNIEYYYLKFFFNASLCLWGFSTVFFVTGFLPMAYDFFFQIEKSSSDILNSVRFEHNLVDYVDFFLELYSQSYMCFQVVLLLGGLFRYLKLSLSVLKTFKKLIYICILLIATIITPPDAFSQFLFFLFLAVNLEIYIFLRIFKENLAG